MRPASTRAKEVSEWAVGADLPVMCITLSPRTVSASAISERWHRQGTASAHMTATRLAAARPSSRAIASQNSSGPARGPHAGGVGEAAAKANVAPPQIGRIGSRLAQASELRHVLVGDPVGRQRLLQRGPGEVRHAPRRGHAADVDQQLDAVVSQQLDQLREAAGRVPDGQDGYGLRWEGSIAATRIRFVYILPPTCTLPEKR